MTRIKYAYLKSAKFLLKNHLEMEWGDLSQLLQLKHLWSGMGEVVPDRTSLTLHPPPPQSPPTVL